MLAAKKTHAKIVSIALIFFLILLNILYISPQPARATVADVSEQTADVRLTLDVPREAAGGSDFNFQAAIVNEGPAAAAGTTFKIEFEPGTTNLNLVCKDTVAGASCPADVQIIPQTEEAPPAIAARVELLPQHGQVSFEITGSFPYSTSASTIFTAELPHGISDSNLETNRVLQQTALTNETPAVSVSAVQDKEVTAVGEPRTYTVTYENTGDVDAEVRITGYGDFFASAEGSAHVIIPFSYSYECDAQLSTMECPLVPGQSDGIDGLYYLWNDVVTVPAGKKLVLKAVLTVGQNACGAIEGDVYLHTRGWAARPVQLPFASGELTEYSEKLVGRVGCADVSTVTTVSDETPQLGSDINVETLVSNSIGYASNLQFEMQLSTEQSANNVVNVLETSKDRISCEVVAGAAVCPDNFFYDATTNKVTATIPKMPKGSALKITVNSTLAAAAKYLESYDVFAEVPGVLGDQAPGLLGTNRSVTTFSWAEPIVTVIPPTPAEIIDACGPDNAIWVKPADSEAVRWEITADKRQLIAYANEGYIFENGRKEHDYGTPVDSLVPCEVPPVNTPPAGEPAPEVPPVNTPPAGEPKLLLPEHPSADVPPQIPEQVNPVKHKGVPNHSETVKSPVTQAKAVAQLAVTGTVATPLVVAMLALGMLICGMWLQQRATSQRRNRP